MICDFVLWFREQAEEFQLRNILFCARDGYLVKQLYDELCNSISSIYFLTSRTAAVRAGMEDEEDICYVGEMKFSGSLKDQLKKRFGVCIDGTDGREKLLDYKDEILMKATENRESERNTSAIFQDYYILETMLTAPMPSVREFDGNGNPVYERETRSAGDIRCFQEAQEGIREYFREYLKLCPISARKVDKKLDEVFLSMIHKVEVRDEDFLHLKVEDPFFNRMTDMVDML